jgi:hypothetical protein
MALYWPRRLEKKRRKKKGYHRIWEANLQQAFWGLLCSFGVLCSRAFILPCTTTSYGWVPIPVFFFKKKI